MYVSNGMEAVLKTSKDIVSLMQKDFKELPMVKTVPLSRIHNSADDQNYQGVSLARHEQGLTFIEPHKSLHAETILSCLRDRTKVQHSLLTDIITILATQLFSRKYLQICLTMLRDT